MPSRPNAPLLEVCVDDPAGLAAAIAGGADRIELCAALAVSGLTPSPGLIAQAAESPIPVCAMIRPRPGGFIYSPEELDAAFHDIKAVKAAGLAGIVTGATLPDGRLDLDTMARLRDAAEGLELVIHRAFDLSPDLDEALEQAIELGACRILTAGGTRAAPEGIEALARLSAQAGDRITIMAGGGVLPENAARLLAAGVHDLHASCTSMVEDPHPATRINIPASRPQTLAENVRALREAMERVTEDAQ
ncbi:copper homeostasis protein CutC [Paracoccus aestuariivivens]|uniref:PF03932 family protein CutC n=1 Tax=Paracoccus aestuariivivens TaxID=1820333 RepID=A0A6L6J4D2_9RHOB|nr:copper homeostasis protein CutC [Paracoccus aestuariivivens]MTH76973.1 copper homeostasis protein CutC [Paracoccus aestuariivivens]